MSGEHTPCRALVTNMDDVEEVFDDFDDVWISIVIIVITIQRHGIENPNLRELIDCKHDQSGDE